MNTPHSKLRPTGRTALLIGLGAPLLLSLLVHAGVGAFVRVYEWIHSPRQLTDSPTEAVLSLVEPTQPTVADQPPAPEPPPPAPAVSVEAVEFAEPEPQPPPPAAAANHIAAIPMPPNQSAPPAPALAAPSKIAVFAGIKADRAERIVYVVDASGPMASSLAFVCDELSRSIERLEPEQSFQVVLFRQVVGDDGPGYEAFPAANARASLVPAIRTHKDAARAWLRSVAAEGKSVPLSGLRGALMMKPDLVYLLTRSIPRDGPGTGAGSQWGSGQSEVLETLDGLNPADEKGRRPTVIKTIQFLDDDPSGLLKAIASIHGDGAGSYSILRLEDLR